MHLPLLAMACRSACTISHSTGFVRTREASNATRLKAFQRAPEGAIGRAWNRPKTEVHSFCRELRAEAAIRCADWHVEATIAPVPKQTLDFEPTATDLSPKWMPCSCSCSGYCYSSYILLWLRLLLLLLLLFLLIPFLFLLLLLLFILVVILFFHLLLIRFLLFLCLTRLLPLLLMI